MDIGIAIICCIPSMSMIAVFLYISVSRERRAARNPREISFLSACGLCALVNKNIPVPGAKVWLTTGIRIERHADKFTLHIA